MSTPFFGCFHRGYGGIISYDDKKPGLDYNQKMPKGGVLSKYGVSFLRNGEGTFKASFQNGDLLKGLTSSVKYTAKSSENGTTTVGGQYKAEKFSLEKSLKTDGCKDSVTVGAVANVNALGLDAGANIAAGFQTKANLCRKTYMPALAELAFGAIVKKDGSRLDLSATHKFIKKDTDAETEIKVDLLNSDLVDNLTFGGRAIFDLAKVGEPKVQIAASYKVCCAFKVAGRFDFSDGSLAGSFTKKLGVAQVTTAAAFLKTEAGPKLGDVSIGISV